MVTPVCLVAVAAGRSSVRGRSVWGGSRLVHAPVLWCDVSHLRRFAAARKARSPMGIN